VMTTTTTPAESDPFLQLLTEALRAGPGSAQWGQAVATLRDGGVEGADEYRLLLRARENIELGRDFRKVTAGPGFTRKVLEAVEREGTRRNGIPTATIVAILSGVVILGVIVTAIVIMSRGDAAKDPQQAAIERLEAASFPVAVASANFRGSQTVPGGWRLFGDLPLDFTKGLTAGTVSKPATGPTTQTQKLFYLGGIVSTDPLSPDEGTALEAELVLPPEGGLQATSSLFVSDSQDVVTGMSSHAGEIAWIYRDGRAIISVNGRMTDSVSFGAPGSVVKVSIRLNDSTVIIDAGNQRMYAGAHGLQASRPRYAGVTFLRAASEAGEAGNGALVRSLDVSRSAPSAAAGGR
jgi:hypothetical protein